MSFGFSDIVTVLQVTTRAYNNWKNACGEYAEITGQLNSLNVILRRLKREADAPESLLRREEGDYAELLEILRNSRATVTELDDAVVRFKTLGRSRKRNWDRMRHANKNLGDMRSRLALHTEFLTAHLNTIGVGALGRIEREAKGLSEMRATIDNLAAQMRAGKREGSVMTVYEDDDQTIWREFRRELIGEGFSSAFIQKYKSDLMRYLRGLHQDGLLDEQAPPASDDDDVASFDNCTYRALPWTYFTYTYDDVGFKCSAACESPTATCYNPFYWHSRDEELSLEWSCASPDQLARGYELESEAERERQERIRLQHLHFKHHEIVGRAPSCDRNCSYFLFRPNDFRPRRIEYNIPRRFSSSTYRSGDMLLKTRVMQGVLNGWAYKFEAENFRNELYYENMAGIGRKNRFWLPPSRHDISCTSETSSADCVAALQRRSNPICNLLQTWYAERQRCPRCFHCW